MLPVVLLTAAFARIVASDARLEVIYKGEPGDSFEGPVWVETPQPGYLVFTNAPGNDVLKWTEDGRVSIFLDHIFTGDPATALRGGDKLMRGANGATLDRQGRLIYTSYSAGQIVRVEKDGKRTVLAERFDGKKINAPNDVVVKSDGTVYFTDSRASSAQTSGPECAQFWMLCGHPDGVTHKGVYFVKPNGEVHLFSRTVDHPNGLAFSRDEKYLYVSNTIRKNIIRFDSNGANEQVFANMSADTAPGAPDGIKVDVQGNVYCTGPGGIWVLSPTGQHVGTIMLPERATNFAFGGNDGTTLFIEGVATLYRIAVQVPGL